MMGNHRPINFSGSEGQTRLLLWLTGVLCEDIAPMFGLRFPGLGRSLTTDWTIDGGHLLERCQLFVIVALGESVLATGIAFGHHAEWHPVDLFSLFVSFAGSLAMWWMYFDTSAAEATHAIGHSSDPGAMGANFHYTHVILVAGIIVSVVADAPVGVGRGSAQDHGDDCRGRDGGRGAPPGFLTRAARQWRRLRLLSPERKALEPCTLPNMTSLPKAIPEPSAGRQLRIHACERKRPGKTCLVFPEAGPC